MVPEKHTRQQERNSQWPKLRAFGSPEASMFVENWTSALQVRPCFGTARLGVKYILECCICDLCTLICVLSTQTSVS